MDRHQGVRLPCPRKWLLNIFPKGRSNPVGWEGGREGGGTQVRATLKLPVDLHHPPTRALPFTPNHTEGLRGADDGSACR
jgi:hypothetical protein